MKVQRRPTRRDYRGDVVNWTYRVTLSKQGVLDFVRVCGMECWARARGEGR